MGKTIYVTLALFNNQLKENNMLRGTRIIVGDNMKKYRQIETVFRDCLHRS